MENEIQNQTTTPMRKQLILALAKVQGAIKNPVKDTDNPFFKSKYADLASVWDSVRGLLSANDLAFVQMPTTEGAKVSVTGMLLHASGEYMESTLTGTAKDTSPQSIGSAITYFRRYQLSAMLGIAAEDDDGNAAQAQEKPKTARQERPTFAGGMPLEQREAEIAAREAAKPPAQPQADLGSFEDRVKSCKVSGEGKTAAGKAWIRYHIETEGHGTFTTFEAQVYNDARQAVTTGDIVMVHSEPTARGPKISGFSPVEVNAVA